MGTNLNKKHEQKDVQLHNVRIERFCEFYGLTNEEAISAIELLDDNLNHGYTSEISLVLKDKMQVTGQVIRHVKAGNSKNAILFNFLLDFAIECKYGLVAAKKEIKKKLTA